MSDKDKPYGVHSGQVNQCYLDLTWEITQSANVGEVLKFIQLLVMGILNYGSDRC